MTAPAETLTLADFLLARIAEDEEVAKDVHRGPHWWVEDIHQDVAGEWVEAAIYGGGKALAWFDEDYGSAHAYHMARHDPARVLAECEAKRRIVEFARRVMASNPGVTQYAFDVNTGMANALGDVIRALASVYADHPEFREEWR